LVRLHGGRVEVTSVVASGSSFSVTIPAGIAHLPAERIGSLRTLASTALGAMPYIAEMTRWQAPATLEAPAEHATVGRAGAYIVLADDNADMRDYLARLLSQYWTVQAVSDGASALAAIKQRTPDLVLADVMMPAIDSFELLRALLNDSQTSVVPVMLLSARAGEESRVEGLRAGADNYLVKPFSAQELIARVQGNLDLAYSYAADRCPAPGDAPRYPLFFPLADRPGEAAHLPAARKGQWPGAAQPAHEHAPGGSGPTRRHPSRGSSRLVAPAARALGRTARRSPHRRHGLIPRARS